MNTTVCRIPGSVWHYVIAAYLDNIDLFSLRLSCKLMLQLFPAIELRKQLIRKECIQSLSQNEQPTGADLKLLSRLRASRRRRGNNPHDEIRLVEQRYRSAKTVEELEQLHSQTPVGTVFWDSTSWYSFLSSAASFATLEWSINHFPSDYSTQSTLPVRSAVLRSCELSVRYLVANNWAIGKSTILMAHLHSSPSIISIITNATHLHDKKMMEEDAFLGMMGKKPTHVQFNLFKLFSSLGGTFTTATAQYSVKLFNIKLMEWLPSEIFIGLPVDVLIWQALSSDEAEIFFSRGCKIKGPPEAIIKSKDIALLKTVVRYYPNIDPTSSVILKYADVPMLTFLNPPIFTDEEFQRILNLCSIDVICYLLSRNAPFPLNTPLMVSKNRNWTLLAILYREYFLKFHWGPEIMEELCWSRSRVFPWALATTLPRSVRVCQIAAQKGDLEMLSAAIIAGCPYEKDDLKAFANKTFQPHIIKYLDTL